MSTMITSRIPSLCVVAIACACSIASGLIVPTPLSARTPLDGFVDVTTYLPANHVTNGTIDYREPIQRCLDEHPAVYFPGGPGAAEPMIYGCTAGLQTREGARIVFGPHAVLKRLPSRGRFLGLADGTHLQGVVIDGNKYRHWPQFKSQVGEAIQIGNECLLEDCLIYDYPGYAYMARNSVHSRFYRCRAENIGYIDVMFAVNFYFGKPSETGASDGFYTKGHNNLLVDCVMVDCQRWAYTINGGSHNTLIRCRAGELNFHTYGFIFANGEGDRLIGCVSPDMQIDAGGAEPVIVDTTASFIDARAARLRIEGCTFYGPLFAANLVDADGGAAAGPASPLITNNRMYMPRPWKGHPLTVMGRDGEGIVAHNVVHVPARWRDLGGGIRAENVRHQVHNTVISEAQPAWSWPNAPPARYRRARFDRAMLERRRVEVAGDELAQYLRKIGAEADPADRHVIIGEFPFRLDAEDQGLREQWFLPRRRPGDLAVKHVGSHWPDVKKNYGAAGPGWHFIPFDMPAGRAAEGALLHFGSVDSDCRVWLNGEFLGEHHVWDEPFHFDIARTVRPGRNDLVVRVTTDYGIVGIYKPISLVVASRPAGAK